MQILAYQSAALQIVNKSFLDRLAVGCSIALMLFVIVMTTGEQLHARIIQWGADLWPIYGTLREPTPEPQCRVISDIEGRVDALEQQHEEENASALFATEFDRQAAEQSVISQNGVCQELKRRWAAAEEQRSPSLSAYLLLDRTVGYVASLTIKAGKLILALVIFVSALVACIRQHHISFRPIRSSVGYRIATITQAAVNGVLTYSAWAVYQQARTSGTTNGHDVTLVLLVGFAALTLVNLVQSLRPPEGLTARARLGEILLAIPLYAWLGVFAAGYFLFVEGYPAGLALHFGAIFELSSLFLQIALFLWVGMLLKQTRLAERILAVFKPWNFPPEVLCVVMVALMALPTAYTGGSGIIVLALGALVYEELRRVGTRRQLAMATTAMTGSAGIVLNPCILILMIAILNKQVVTGDLYHEGLKVFVVSLVAFAAVVLLTRKGPLTVAPWRHALPAMFGEFRHLVGYVVVIAVVVLFYGLALGVWMDEFTAAIMLPVIIIGMLLWEKRSGQVAEGRVMHRIGRSGDESVVHIGALLMFIGASLLVGGVVQRGSGDTGMMTLAFESPLVCIAVLMVALVLIGMIMESMSGVVFVSATLAQLAYDSGVNPLHFWMVTLVAMELGFLTPPIALNQLYTRQVVGELEAELASAEEGSFWYRHERYLLPVAIMTLVLLVVTFGPFLTGYGGWYGG